MTHSKKITFTILFFSILGGFLFYYKNHQALIVNHPVTRLGDHLLSYSKAKLLAYKYKVPFALVSFPDADCFVLSSEDHYRGWSFTLERMFYKIFGKTVWVNDESDLANALNQQRGPTRFVVHLFTRLNEHVATDTGKKEGENSWIPSLVYEYTLLYPEFGKQLKAMLQPLKPVAHLELPSDRISVAVHLRKGGGHDPELLSQQYYKTNPDTVTYEQFSPSSNPNDLLKAIPTCPVSFAQNFADKIFPDKFPPEQYYVDQIKNLSEFLDNAPLYIHVFTDDRDPVALVKRLESAVRKKNILFGCRTSKNTHDTNVLDDWHVMANFDCLIRSGSHFSYSSQLVGSHKLIIYPLHLEWVENNTLVVNKVGVTIRDKNLFNNKFGLQKNKGSS